jgi:hypothetical protein
MHKYRAMIPLVFTALLVTAALPAVAQRGDDADRASKNGKVEGTIDGVTVTLEYGRPNVKGRTIWGGLVPYGKVWRTGADEATTITFSADVEIGGEKLAAGTYSLYTLPGEDEWTVIFNKVADQWGTRYDAGQDALRVTATPKAVDHVEEMDFEVVESWVVLRWEKLAVPFEVKKAG